MKNVDVEAIGDPHSGKGCFQKHGRWHGVALFRPWRLWPDGKPSRQMLRVELPGRATSREAFDDGGRVETGVTYRFRAKPYRRAPNMMQSMRIVGPLRPATAAGGLARADAQVSARLKAKDPVLGALVRPPRQAEWEGKVVVLGRSVPLSVKGPVDRAARLFVAARKHLPGVRRAMSARMLKLANTRWLDAPITAAQFERTLVPTEATLNGKTLTIWFDCGEVFADHGLTATIGPRGVTRVELA